MLWREYLFLLAGIESEDLRFVGAVLSDMRGGFLTRITGGIRVAFGVFAFSHLYGGAAATPSVWRIVVVPEYYLHINPDKLSDRELAEKLMQLADIRKKENSGK